VFLISLTFVFSGVPNIDNPAKGEITFELEKIWTIEGAGDNLFAQVRTILVDDKETVYVDDEKNETFYIFDKNGKSLTSFGKTGEGPGEIRDFYRSTIYLKGEKLIIEESNRLHYFDNQGRFIKSIVITDQQIPVLFINEDQYITAPRHLLHAPEGKGKIRLINLKTKEDSVISQFSMFEGGALNNNNVRAAAVIPALTPMMVIGYHDNHLYYGMSDQFKITITDRRGRVLKTFSLKRNKRTISEEVKVSQLLKIAKGRAPEELLKRLAKTMPNVMTHFSSLQVHNDLIYVFTSYYIRKNIQQIDIFSSQGKYLYRAFIKVPEEYTLAIQPYLKGNHLYAALENEEGEQMVAKYKIDLPNG
jgi:hypothetical protein